MECKNCGKEIPEDSTFCPNCGNITNSNKSNKKFQLKTLSLKTILMAIAVGIWMLVLQNLGVIPVAQDVRIKKTVKVSGNVDVDNTIDVNLQEINGRSDVFFNNPKRVYLWGISCNCMKHYSVDNQRLMDFVVCRKITIFAPVFM